MFWKSKKHFRSFFLLLEVLISLTLFSLFVPNLFHDFVLYHKEVQKLKLYNDFDNAFREHLFNVYMNLYEKPYFQKLSQLGKTFEESDYLPLSFNGKSYKTYLLWKREDQDPESKNYQVLVKVKVSDFPFKDKSYQSNLQKFYLKKNI